MTAYHGAGAMGAIHIEQKGHSNMLTPEEIERFADWIIEQENKMMDLRYPIPPHVQDMTDEELLRELGVAL